MLIEDLHWLDAARRALLDHLIEGASVIRLLLVGNYRTEYRAGWLTMEHCCEIALTPLGPDATQQLLGDSWVAILRWTDSTRSSSAHERHPLLHRRGGQVARRGRGPRRTTRRLPSGQDAGPVRMPVLGQVGPGGPDRTAPPAERTPAARLGDRQCDQRAVAPPGRHRSRTPSWMRRSVRWWTGGSSTRPLNHPRPNTPSATRSPRRWRIGRRSASGTDAAHRTVAQAIIELRPIASTSVLRLIAHHWEAAGEVLEAANWSVRAAGWAGYNDQALATLHWRKVRSPAARLGPSPEATPLGITAAVMILALGWRLGGLSADGGQFFEDEAVEIYAEGRKLAESIGSGNEPMLAALAMGYTTARGLTGHIDEFQLVLEAVDLADRSGDVDLRVAMRAGTTYPRFIAGHVADALRIADEGMELTGGDPSVGAGIAYACPLAAMLMVRGLLLGCQGRLKEGFADLERALQAEREVEDPDVRGWAPGVGVWLAHWAGFEGEDVLTNARRCVELTERAGGGFSRALGYTFLTEAHLLRQAWDDALTAGTQALAVRHGSHIALESEAMDHQNRPRSPRCGPRRRRPVRCGHRTPHRPGAGSPRRPRSRPRRHSLKCSSPRAPRRSTRSGPS